ncbi:MAG: hypothetical protein OXU78_01555, partial [Deltaproteobacteria bacterium]|nr:hypothetical protein [Deltaproteobacteria bacterium]
MVIKIGEDLTISRRYRQSPNNGKNPPFRAGTRNPDAMDGNLNASKYRQKSKDAGLRLPPEWRHETPPTLPYNPAPTTPPPPTMKAT